MKSKTGKIRQLTEDDWIMQRGIVERDKKWWWSKTDVDFYYTQGCLSVVADKLNEVIEAVNKSNKEK